LFLFVGKCVSNKHLKIVVEIVSNLIRAKTVLKKCSSVGMTKILGALHINSTPRAT
jgi:hypothetical protein